MDKRISVQCRIQEIADALAKENMRLTICYGRQSGKDYVKNAFKKAKQLTTNQITNNIKTT